MIGEVLKLDEYVRKQILRCGDKLIDELVVVGATQPATSGTALTKIKPVSSRECSESALKRISLPASLMVSIIYRSAKQRYQLRLSGWSISRRPGALVA
jgi:hypothetical protein